MRGLLSQVKGDGSGPILVGVRAFESHPSHSFLINSYLCLKLSNFICISSKSLSEKYCDLQYLQLATCKIRMELDIMDRL